MFLMRRFCNGGQALFSCITCSVISLLGCKALEFTGETRGEGKKCLCFVQLYL